MALGGIPTRWNFPSELLSSIIARSSLKTWMRTPGWLSVYVVNVCPFFVGKVVLRSMNFVMTSAVSKRPWTSLIRVSSTKGAYACVRALPSPNTKCAYACVTKCGCTCHQNALKTCVTKCVETCVTKCVYESATELASLAHLCSLRSRVF